MKESKLRRKYVLNLLNKTQHLAETKTPKFLKIPNKGATYLRERKLKNNWLKLCENKLKVREKCSRNFAGYFHLSAIRDIWHIKYYTAELSRW